MTEEKVRVDITNYRDQNGDLWESRRVNGRVIYEDKVLFWHGQKPYFEIGLYDVPWKKEENV